MSFLHIDGTYINKKCIQYIETCQSREDEDKLCVKVYLTTIDDISINESTHSYALRELSFEIYEAEFTRFHHSLMG